MKYDFVVLGATGMQGKIVVKDLIECGYSVLMCGRDKSRILHLLNKFKKKTNFIYVDIRDINHAANVIKKSGANVVVNCIECDWNLHALSACIKAGVHSIDLGSDIPMTKIQLKKDLLLKKKGLIHITGSGSVPGIGNVMLCYASLKFNKIDEIDVGFAWDSNIKKFVVPFSMKSILNEFTTPAPYISHNKIVKVKPLDTVIACKHRAISKENQFLVDHHPETYTFYRHCKNKGIETVKFFAGFPDHSFNKIRDIVELGFSSSKEINVDGNKVKPIEFIVELLKDLKYPPGYKEKENLWVKVSNKKKSILMECIVPTLKGWKDAGCNIDTGMPASIMAQMVKQGIIKKSGAFAPEEIVPPKPFFKELRKRKMIVMEDGKIIN